MEIKKNDFNISFNKYLSTINSLIMPHVQMEKLNKQQKKIYPESLVYYSYTKLHSEKKQKF